MTVYPQPRFRDPLQKNDALFLYGARQDKPFVFAYCQNSTEVVHGPACIPEKEIILDRCAQDHVPVWRRRTGGGTVVLSAGIVVTVIVGNREGPFGAPRYFTMIHEAMIGLLSREGVPPLRHDGISDLSCNNRKILGSSLYLGTSPAMYYYQSSLLVDSDLSLLPRYLHHPPREPQYRQQRSHSDFCTTLAREGYAHTPESVADLFNCRLATALPHHSGDTRHHDETSGKETP